MKGRVYFDFKVQKPHTEHYVTYWWPGFLMSDETVRQIKSRPKDETKFSIPQEAFAYMFHDIDVVTLNGGTKYRSGELRRSLKYIEGVELTLDDVMEKYSDKEILISNMKINKWPVVVKTRFEQFIPLRDDWVVLKNVRRTKE